ncbi:hypothetical protein ASE36_17790 [Rhizobium sp. Root274]|uniref:hypothetical protein n=1 Tax=unclassified Rhizobium TaxID=2613769 RepID=UPI0007144364|nr:MULTISPECIES: hypothetical protein [unclassified Rhizobium]KQW27457.1 hypothetical protein ASC71_17815 [Rhizobium sp. Root1240]KRD27694.1 hypothetical protein ASE36_17790 [Rhizobium sp. Root274]
MTNLQPAEIPMILTPQDFSVMEQAMRGVGSIGIESERDGHREAVGKAVIRLYTAGVTDPAKLAEAAGIMAATRLLDRRR